MFKVSRRVDYGLRLLIALASEVDSGPQATAILADKLDIPLAFLHQIGRSLIQAGYIKASPGPGGGLKLNRLPETISLKNVLEVLEGPISLTGEGVLQDSDRTQGEYSTNAVWEEIQDQLIAYLDKVYLSRLVDSNKKEPGA